MGSEALDPVTSGGALGGRSPTRQRARHGGLRRLVALHLGIDRSDPLWALDVFIQWRGGAFPPVIRDWPPALLPSTPLATISRIYQIEAGRTSPPGVHG
jgi:hypothetical protein